jgi:hypothetical protein
MFILYDGRARRGDPEEASVLDTAATEDEARREGATTWAGYDAVWFEYVKKDNALTMPKMRMDIPPARKNNKRNRS